MHGSLSLKDGVLYVGRHEKTAHVRLYDLDGHSLGRGFSFRDETSGRASATGIDVDADHAIWIADTANQRVRAFSVFGVETRKIEGRPGGQDRPGALGDVVDVVCVGEDEEQLAWIASSGSRRHAVQCFASSGALLDSLRPLGDPEGQFLDVRGVAVAGRFAYVCEARAGRVQVFRDGQFHFSFAHDALRSFEPVAAAPLEDGRVIVAHGGSESGVTLFDSARRVVSTLAEHGEASGEVFEPNDVTVEWGRDDSKTRVAAIDRDGDRVQVFTLEGRCYGSFSDLPHAGL